MDDAILAGALPSDVNYVQNNARARAQQVCTYLGYGALFDFAYGNANANMYATVIPDGTVQYVNEPPNVLYNGVMGYAQGFSQIRCYY